MRRWRVIGFLLGVLTIGGGPTRAAEKPAETVKNPFGVMIGAGSLSSSQRMHLVKTLGGASVRPIAIFLDRWEGIDAECDAALKEGVPLILTVRNSGGMGKPSAPPIDLAAYKKSLAVVLDHYHPELLVIENEENSKAFYSGTPEQYRGELAAAVEIAHRKNIPCTNGGLASMLVAALVYDDYVQHGEKAKADSFAGRVFTQAARSVLNGQEARDSIARGKALLGAYKATKIDYVNFHWFLPDPDALGEAVTFLRRQVDIPAITNEIGQRDLRPETVTTLLSKVLDLKLPYAVWYSIDSPTAKALTDRDGTLRANGTAFQKFMKSHFSGGAN